MVDECELAYSKHAKTRIWKSILIYIKNRSVNRSVYRSVKRSVCFLYLYVYHVVNIQKSFSQAFSQAFSVSFTNYTNRPVYTPIHIENNSKKHHTHSPFCHFSRHLLNFYPSISIPVSLFTFN